MDPTEADDAATTGAAASMAGEENADLILYRIKSPKYPPRIAAATRDVE